MTKYTSIFLVPAALLYISIWERKLFKNKDFYIAILIALVILSPLIIYNYMVFVSRGHFEAALSIIFKMNPDDYKGLSQAGVLTLTEKFRSFFDSHFSSMSLGFFALGVISVFYAGKDVFTKKAEFFKNFLFTHYAVASILLIYGGSQFRHYSLTIPFILIFISVFLYDIYKRIQTKKYLCFVFLLFFSGSLHIC